MSISRNAFHSDMPLGSYREELMKSKETLMANHVTARTPTKSFKNSPRSARAFQFVGGGGGGGVNGGASSGINIGCIGAGGESAAGNDCNKSKSFNFEKAKDMDSNFPTCGRDVFKFSNHSEDNCIGGGGGGSVRNSQFVRFDRCSLRNYENKKMNQETETKSTPTNSEDMVYGTPVNGMNDIGHSHSENGSGATTIINRSVGNSLDTSSFHQRNLDDDWKDLSFTKNSTFQAEGNNNNNLTNMFETSDTNMQQQQQHNVGTSTLTSTAGSGGVIYTEMNYVIFCGLLLGLAASKFVNIVFRYFTWLLDHVLHMRNMFLRPYSIADLLNFEDNSRFSLRHKVILLPLISICCLVYSLISIFNRLLRLSLNQVPKGFLVLLQKW